MIATRRPKHEFREEYEAVEIMENLVKIGDGTCLRFVQRLNRETGSNVLSQLTRK